jgi:hypothetical protein
MTKKPQESVQSLGALLQKQVANQIMTDRLSDNPRATYTELAESAAVYLDHDEWLDNPEHWIWDMALSIGDPT